MPKSPAPYPAEFQQQIIELVQMGRTQEELARKFEPTAQIIYNWVKQAARDAGRRHQGKSMKAVTPRECPPGRSHPAQLSSVSAGFRL